QQPGHHPKGGRLPGPVWPDQPEEAPMRDVQIDPAHRQLGPERLPQPARRQRGRRASTSRRFPCPHAGKPIPCRSYTAGVDPSPAPEEAPGASPDLLDGLKDAQRLAVPATEGPAPIVPWAGPSSKGLGCRPSPRPACASCAAAAPISATAPPSRSTTRATPSG